MAGAQGLTPLGAEDARILSLERGQIRGHTLKVLVVDDAPHEGVVDQLRGVVAARLTGLPRWRRRLVAAPGTGTGLAWEDDPAFDITRHVRSASGERLDDEGLRRFVAESMRTPLDRSHPMWRLDVLPRLSDGRWALVWKVHHCLADGVTIMRVGGQLLWDDGDSRPAPSSSAATDSPGPTAQVAAGMRLARVLGYRGLFWREFRRVRQLSPLAGEVGPEREVAFARCTIDELHAIAKSVGAEVTVNDVLLALVAAAMRDWLHTRGRPITPMKVQVPVSMHLDAARDGTGGNRDSFLLVDLPLTEADPVARVRSVNAATRLRKNRHDARAIYALRESLSHAPAPVRRRLQHVAQGPHEYSLNVSNVPGPRGRVHVLGRHVAAMYSVAEVAPHHGLRVAAVSLEGVMSIGLCADPRVVPGLDVLAEGVRRAADDLGRARMRELR